MWFALAVFFFLGGFRGLIAWCLLVIVFGMLGCTPMTAEQRDQEQYEHVEWVETQFKPAVDACERDGGILVYEGPYTQRIRRILDTRDWSRVHRSEWLSFRCAKRS
jgi:hypothetical protein